MRERIGGLLGTLAFVAVVGACAVSQFVFSPECDSAQGQNALVCHESADDEPTDSTFDSALFDALYGDPYDYSDDDRDEYDYGYDDESWSGADVNGGCNWDEYPDFCVPYADDVGDLDCDDVDSNDFTVEGYDDEHGFDRDGDGIGCES